ncbi:MAG: DUF4238 domain-containing protein [Candidatus Sulfotelmatobacter sp.]
MKNSKEQSGYEAVPRAHHFVPQCWLAGFTETGQKDGRLWVTDLRRRKQWLSSPTNAGHRRDFYRVSDESADPTAAEKLFSKIEDAAAPILRRIDEELRTPTRDELETLLFFMAVQWVRVPAFRPTMLAIADKYHRSEISKALKTRESWIRMLVNAGISSDDPAADYERMCEFERSGQYSLSAETEWFLMRGLQGVETIFSRLKERHWGACISQKGSFIGNDNPVAMDGPKNCEIGFKNAEIVIHPASKHILLFGTAVRVRPPFVNQMFISRNNTFAMLAAEAQIYSAASDFCWLDANRAYQTDWKNFSKETYQL